MQESETVDERTEARSDSRRERTYRFTGLADLLPDCVLPQEGKQHVRNARREALLAMRSVLDAWIERLDQGATVRRTPTKIEVE